MKRLAFLIIAFSLVLTPVRTFAYSSNICATEGISTCTEVEVGPFMQDISKGCGNLGDCSLGDIMTVFVNVGNYVMGLIGAIVLLMYVVGGFYWLASAGRKEWVDKGKKYMTISTTGLLIVLFSYLGILALRGVLQTGSVAFTDTNANYVVCSGPSTEGEACGLNMTCVDDGYTCKELCLQRNATEATVGDASDGIGSATYYYDCVNKDTFPDQSSEGNPFISPSGCTPNLCPGAANIQCCRLELDI